MKTILYLTDFYYEAKGRKYYEEDLYLNSKLHQHFNILIGHPQRALAYLTCADLIIFRNTGPVSKYQEYFNKFLETVADKNIPTFNSFDGKGDIKGKQYLFDLFTMGFPVIPIVGNIFNLEELGNPIKYIVKPLDGADSFGMEILSKEELLITKPENKIIQPFIDFQYEVSFYYLGNQFQYALYAPDKSKRWELMEYSILDGDIEFADQFIKWNNMTTGITRVDACRLEDGSLLLVELEDLNPFLSIHLLPENKRNRFINSWVEVLQELIGETSK
ncbi:hypothetical protein [Pedobacter immunditicola]|uniref:hypothetical protein n=1 Tax=Pedobacter immunditicola TaxID=3133440 RepID=UPI0030AF35A6